jgi:Zn-dependent metalloprotease
MGIEKGTATRNSAVVVIAVLAVAVVGTWFLNSSGAQTVSQQAPSADTRIVLESSSGTVVTRSQENVSAETSSQLRQLLSRYPGNWEIEVADGRVKNLKPLMAVAVDLPAKDFSRSFLSEFSTLFGITSTQAAYQVEFNLRDRRVVEYRQVVNDVPVENSFMTFAVKEARLEQVTSRVYPTIDPASFGTTPTIENEKACEVATGDFGKTLGKDGEPEFKCKGDLVILPKEKAFHLAWKLLVQITGELTSYTYYVDARNGRVIMKYSNLRSQSAESPKPVARQRPTLSVKEETSGILHSRQPFRPPGSPESESKPNVPRPPLADSPSPAANVWETILNENFDVNNFPYSPWQEFDNNGTTGGELYWDDTSCFSHTPSWSLWAADDGANHLNACSDNYANDMDSWVVYGPFSLANSTDGLLEFYYNNVSETNFDYFKWMASVDGTHFYGFQFSGNSNGWKSESLDLKNVPTLGNITGRSQVWIAFAFITDSSVISGKGAFVDDVSIKRLINSSCTGVSGHVAGHIYGKNMNELQVKDFKNMKVVLNNTLALDSYTSTNATGNYSSSQCSDYVRFELEGYGSNNFLKVQDCDNGNCLFGGNVLASQDFTFASTVNYDWNVDVENKKEVNVFWHVNDVHDWFAALIGQDLLNYQMQAYVDYVDSPLFGAPLCAVGRIQAFYNDDDMYFCPSDVSRESDVIYHEFTHGVVDHIPNYSLPVPDEGGAMNEGFADYFAAAKNNDPVIGEGVGTIRTLTNVVNYNDKCAAETSICGQGQYFVRTTAPDREKNDNGFVHHNSLVPSGALWNLRQSQGLSSPYVDELVIDTLILRKPLNFNELLSGLIAQDGGSHSSQISAAFLTRGVGGTPGCTYSLQPSSQIFIASASSGSFNIVTSSNCSWTAISNASWLTTNSSGSGNGTVNYLVAANTGNSRTGTLTVGGQTFSVFQSAGNGSGCPQNSISLGQTVNATLTTGCVFTGTSRYVDPYTFTGTAGQQVIIAMNSSVFDTFLFLNGPDNHTIAQDDDSGGGLNSRIPSSGAVFTLPLTGTYTIYATSYSADGLTGSTGAYGLSLLNGASLTEQLSASSYSVNEAAVTLTLTATRSGSTASAASVDYFTSDTAGLQSCTLVNGRASERCDYVTSLGTVRFAAGESSKTFTLTIINDVLVEGNETFTITLRNPTGGVLGTTSSATVTITDNDTTPSTTNPIDGVEFFIRQQYADLLNRQPDATGLQNWINTLSGCPNGGFGEPPASNCDRLHVAAGFFQSDEFLNRGYWVFRMYMVALNQRPTYSQFIPDMAQVGGPKSPAEEEAAKAAFAEAFVQRSAFTAKYGSTSGQALANALTANAGLPTYTVSTGQTNGQILRAISERQTSLDKFLTEGTVSILYFGFQRRDPDTIGYQNNVATLNANPNNLRHMIFIFIYSTEYRQRFGPS